MSTRPTQHHMYQCVPVTLSLVFVECTTGLEQRLVDTSTTSNNTDSCSARARDSLLGTAGQTDTSLILFRRVTDNSSVVAGCPCERTTITGLLLNVANDCTFRALGDGKNVSDSESSLLAAVDEGTSVQALSGNESLLAELVAVWVPEDDTGKRGTTKKANVFRWLNSASSGRTPTGQDRG